MSKESIKYNDFVETIYNFLKNYAKDEKSKEIAYLVAKKSVEPNHLYEDLGFKSRKVMNQFMSNHFPELSKKRPSEIRWKKFLYDNVNLVAPACVHCYDKEDCFECKLIIK